MLTSSDVSSVLCDCCWAFFEGSLLFISENAQFVMKHWVEWVCHLLRIVRSQREVQMTEEHFADSQHKIFWALNVEITDSSLMHRWDYSRLDFSHNQPALSFTLYSHWDHSSCHCWIHCSHHHCSYSSQNQWCYDSHHHWSWEWLTNLFWWSVVFNVMRQIELIWWCFMIE